MSFPNIIFGSDGDQFTVSAPSADLQGSPAVGDQLCLQDGRTFRYSSAGAVAVVVGKLYQAAIPVTNHVLQTAAAAAVGAKTIVLTLGATAVTPNQYQNGYVTIDLVSNTGFGYGYGIDAHGAVASSGAFTIPLKSTVQVAVATTANSISLVPNRGQGAILAVATTPTAEVNGVSVKPIPIGDFGWIQSKGVVQCLTVTPVAVEGQNVMPATTTGAVMAQSTATSLTVPNIGIGVRTAVTASYATIRLWGLD
jgi:hypothetical protein